MYLEHTTRAGGTFPSLKYKPAVLSETLSWCFSSFSTLVFFTNTQLQIQVKTSAASFEVGSQGSTSYMPCCFVSQGFQLGTVALVAWNNLLPLLSRFMTTGFSELCVSSSTIVSLHNWRVESYVSSTVCMPAALPCGTPAVL